MGKPLRVLIVEDSEDDAALLVRELRWNNYDPTFKRVETAQGMSAALARGPWDVIICDYNLPHFSAPVALMMVQQSGLDLPFVIVSGSIGEDVAVAAMKSGAHDYVMKGNLKRLVPAVEREIREATVRRERKRAEEALKLFRTLIDRSNDAIEVVDPETGRFLDCNEKAWQDIGYSREELLSLRVSDIDPTIDPPSFSKVIEDLRKSGFLISEGYHRRKDGSTFPVEVNIKYVRLDRDYVVAVVRDITERRQAEEVVQRMSHYDTLTGLPNRATLYNHLLNAIRTDAGKGKPLALLLMDLDRFKEINDTLGHDRGDEILRQVGRRVQEVVFDRDIAARPGGDEFSVLLLNMSHSKDIDVAVDKILKALDPPFLIENLPIRIEASIGIALYPDHGQAAEILFRRADIAMHISKRVGSSYVMYDPAQDKHSPQRLALMGELHDAIEHEELVLFYQPKVSLKTRQTIGVEALVRWKHPSRGMIPPDQFILPAEQTGLIHPMTRWITAEGMRQCKVWHEAGTALTVSVNLSARNLLDPKLPGQVAEQLKSAGVAPDWMTFEITESAVMADPAHALDVLMRLHEMGIRFSIDDFGTGYSSLAYLKKLPVDSIKIDKSFVINMVGNQNDEVIVRSTIDLAHNLGLKVVAEGVENQDIWDRLASLGCDEAQGYHMARPLPTDELTRWLGEPPMERTVT
ncbi:MAG: EAL domain-containing protein [Nitrospirae bacterium]|nr:EAL domain-containing protein [Nitrospirota bacterium]